MARIAKHLLVRLIVPASLEQRDDVVTHCAERHPALRYAVLAERLPAYQARSHALQASARDALWLCLVALPLLLGVCRAGPQLLAADGTAKSLQLHWPCHPRIVTVLTGFSPLSRVATALTL